MKRTVFNLVGLIFSVVPACVATLYYFPLWIEKGSTETVSGLCALLLILGAVPMLRILKGRLSTPSLPVLWGILFVLFRSLAAIIGELVVIAFVGTLANLVGALFFRLARRGE